jgi:hypothetical protein
MSSGRRVRVRFPRNQFERGPRRTRQVCQKDVMPLREALARALSPEAARLALPDGRIHFVESLTTY